MQRPKVQSSVSPAMKKQVEELAGTPRYVSQSEVVREALRVFFERSGIGLGDDEESGTPEGDGEVDAKLVQAEEENQDESREKVEEGGEVRDEVPDISKGLKKLQSVVNRIE